MIVTRGELVTLLLVMLGLVGLALAVKGVMQWIG